LFFGTELLNRLANNVLRTALLPRGGGGAAAAARRPFVVRLTRDGPPITRPDELLRALAATTASATGGASVGARGAVKVELACARPHTTVTPSSGEGARS